MSVMGMLRQSIGVPQLERSFRRCLDLRRRELRMIITAAHVVRAMIPAMRERGKKMAAIHATKNETQPAASMVSFRIVIEGQRV